MFRVLGIHDFGFTVKLPNENSGTKKKFSASYITRKMPMLIKTSM